MQLTEEPVSHNEATHDRACKLHLQDFFLGDIELLNVPSREVPLQLVDDLPLIWMKYQIKLFLTLLRTLLMQV